MGVPLHTSLSPLLFLGCSGVSWDNLQLDQVQIFLLELRQPWRTVFLKNNIHSLGVDKRKGRLQTLYFSNGFFSWTK